MSSWHPNEPCSWSYGTAAPRRGRDASVRCRCCRASRDDFVIGHSRQAEVAGKVLALQYNLLIETAAVEAEQQESHCLAGGRPAPEGGLCHRVAASSAKAAVAQQRQECEQLRTGGLEALQQREAQLTTTREARDGLMAKVEDSRAQLDSIK